MRRFGAAPIPVPTAVTPSAEVAPMVAADLTDAVAVIRLREAHPVAGPGAPLDPFAMGVEDPTTDRIATYDEPTRRRRYGPARLRSDRDALPTEVLS